MSLPNLLTILRILLVPLAVWLIITDQYVAAFAVFVIAGVTDAVDGFIAKHFDAVTELGAYLDPLADKLLLVSMYVALGIQNYLPDWLVIVVVSRDVLIIGAVILSWLVGNPVRIKPLLLSKANTVAQITLAAVVLGLLAVNHFSPGLVHWGALLTAFLTAASGGQYMVAWMNHMAGNREG
ncbi:MAG: CDP-alcohol phosphatidyltransferase family protein [Hyphomicrobiales bacterium]